LLLHARRQLAVLENLEDVPKRPPMLVSILINLDVDLSGPKGPLHHLTRPKLPPWERELPELSFERGERYPGVQQRGHDHVPRRAAWTIEVRHPHRAKSAQLRDEPIDLAGLMRRAVAVVYVHHRHPRGARVQHGEQRL